MAMLSRQMPGFGFMLLALSACTTKAEDPVDTGAGAAATATAAVADRTADAEAIRSLDQKWLKAAMEKNVDSLMTLYTPDAATLTQGQEPVTTAEARRTWYTNFVNMSLTDAQMNTLGVEFSDDGTMAYDYGTYSGTITPPGAPAMKDRGAYLNVWRKTPTGWKLVAESSSSSLPMTGGEPSPTK